MWSRYFPVATLLMTLLLILCFVFQSWVGATDNIERLGSLFGVSSTSVQNGHIQRLITANFFHVNRGHLLSNLAGLLCFSSLLEIYLGRSRAAIVILLSAIGGTVGSLLFHVVDWMVGSSTILFGVFGGLGVLILKYRKELRQLFFTAGISWCITLVFMATLGYLSLEHVDQGAHVGGFIVGVLSTWLMASPYPATGENKPLSSEGRVLLIALLVIFGVSLLLEVVPLLPLLA